MSKNLIYTGNFKSYLLFDELIITFPEWVYESGEIGPDGQPAKGCLLYMESLSGEVHLTVPDDADEQAIAAVVASHNPSTITIGEQDEQDAQQARADFRNIPQWATWTAQEAIAFVHNDVVSGMTKAEIEAWIDTNVTTLASAKTALKLIGGELVDLRNICEKLAQAVIYLRDVSIWRG